MKILNIAATALLAALTFAPGASASSAATSSQHRCLAEMIYFEARGESMQGQMAVAETILNRVKSPRFPKTVCAVTTQRGQFAPRTRISEPKAFQRAQQVASLALEGKTGNVANGATYFHTPAVSPSWSRQFTRVARIGNHIFYKH